MNPIPNYLIAILLIRTTFLGVFLQYLLHRSPVHYRGSINKHEISKYSYYYIISVVTNMSLFPYGLESIFSNQQIRFMEMKIRLVLYTDFPLTLVMIASIFKSLRINRGTTSMLFRKSQFKVYSSINKCLSQASSSICGSLYVTSAFFFVKNFQDFSFAVSFKRIFGSYSEINILMQKS